MKEIRDLIEARNAATRRRDATASSSCYAADAVIFDVVDPLRRKGREEIRKRAEAWFTQFDDRPIDYESIDLEVRAEGSVGFATSLMRVRGGLKNGGKLEMVWRETLGLEKRDGQWLIVHAHDSVPFNPETGKPSLTLKP